MHSAGCLGRRTGLALASHDSLLLARRGIKLMIEYVNVAKLMP